MIAPRDVEKVYYRSVRENSQRQGPVGESRVVMTRLSWAMEGKRKGDEREQNQVQQPGGPKVQRGRVTKMILLYRGGQPSPLG